MVHSVESVPESVIDTESFIKPLALVLLGGLVLGSDVALIFDCRSDRVFSNSKILGQLDYPLWLMLPTLT